MFTATAPAAPLETVEVTADTAQIVVRTEAGLDEARVEITGPQRAIQGTTARMGGGIWTIKLPKPPAGVGGGAGGFSSRSGGRVTNFVANVSGNGQIIQAGTINGATIFGNPGQVGGHIQQEGIEVTLVLPAGVDLTARIGTGGVDAVDASLRVLDVHTSCGSVQAGRVADAYIHTGSGSVDVRDLTGSGAITTGSGRIEVEGGERLTLTTGSGSIRWTATTAATITARTGSGSIRVCREGHQVDADLHTGSGRIRES